MWRAVKAALHCRFLFLQMTSGERTLAARADVIDELRTLLGRQPFVPVVVDHDDRRAVAGAETLDLHERESAAWIGFARFDPELRAQLLGHTFSAKKRARQR